MLHQNLFFLDVAPAPKAHAISKPLATPNTSVADVSIWHQRLGHIYQDNLSCIQEMVDGVKLTGHKSSSTECSVCQLSKAPQQISCRESKRAIRPGDRIHMDIIDNIYAYNGQRYGVHFLDDATRMHFVLTTPFKTQTEILHCVERICNLMENIWGCKPKVIKTDGERALGQDFAKYCYQKGMIVETSVPHLPNQNGPIEHAGQAIIRLSCSLIHEGQLPKGLWPEAFSAAAYILNWVPTYTPVASPDGTQRSEWIIPIQRMHWLTRQQHVKPDLSNIRLYGTLAYVCLTPDEIQKRDKAAPRAQVGYLVGWTASNIW